MDYLGDLAHKCANKSPKDRKTSFYRTIVKHLKQINYKTLE